MICGVEVIYEYHFHQNLFITWTERLLPRPFELVAASAGSLSVTDSLGRLSITGPTDYGVEVVVMMSMVLPIAIFGILGTKARLRQVAYGLALVVLISAMFATQRKSALVLPGAVILTLVYFRRRELISLAPLGLVVLVMVALVSPGVIHGVITQFTSAGSTHVATVSDRTADYDAVRPDLWTHILLGRGYGSYDPHTYRVLDSEILGPLVETGVLGLLAYLLIGVSVIVARRQNGVTARSEMVAARPVRCGCRRLHARRVGPLRLLGLFPRRLHVPLRRRPGCRGRAPGAGARGTSTDSAHPRIPKPCQAAAPRSCCRQTSGSGPLTRVSPRDRTALV